MNSSTDYYLMIATQGIVGALPFAVPVVIVVLVALAVALAVYLVDRYRNRNRASER